MTARFLAENAQPFLGNRPLTILGSNRPLTTAADFQDEIRRQASEIIRHLESRSTDANPRIRLEAMRALSRIPSPRSAELVLDAAINAPKDDPYYDYAAWLSINDLAKPWTEAIASGAWKAEGKEKQLEFALKSIDPALAGATLARLVSDKKVPLDGTGPWIEILGTAGGPKELGALFAKLTAGQFDKAVTRRVLAAFAEAARLRNVKPEGDLAAIVKLGNDDAYKAGVARLIGRWKLPSGHGVLAASATHPDPKVRLAAFEAMRDFGGKDVLAALPLLTDPKMPGDVRAQAALTFATLDLKGSQPRVFALLAGLESENDALTAWRGLLAIKGAADTLAAGLPKDLPKPIATAGIRAAREAGKNGAKLLAALTPLAGITEAEAKMPKDFTALAGFAKQNGDPARGELIYRRTALACTVCHAIGGAGGKVGPDMTSMGASAPLDYIIESVINPAAKVKEGYNAVTLALKDGKQFTGTQVRETAQEVFLLDATGREQSVPKAQIAGTTNMGSLMPAGLVDQLQDRERLDLFAFLGELGKPGGYDASKGTVARVWQLTAGPMTIPVYTLVDGRLVKDLLAEKLPLFAGAKTVTATARFQSTAGTTRLKITGATKATLDGKPIDPTKDLALPLTADTHTLTVEIDPANPPAVLRAESPDARFLGD